MLLILKHQGPIDTLAEKLRLAELPTSDFVTEIVETACQRIASLQRSGTVASQVNRLIKSEAWTDLALLLIAIELPGWALRHLVHEDGSWFCSLSKQSNLPLELAETADGSHENLPLAILSAFVEARLKCLARPSETETHSIPRIRPAEGHPVCCDNFA
jgi:hypothetical protein